MSTLTKLTTVSFPRIPESILSNEEARPAIAKASAYVTFALEEADVEHDRDPHAAFVTDATYTLEEDCTPDEYLELAIQELAYAEGEIPQSEFRNALAEYRRTIQEIIE